MNDQKHRMPDIYMAAVSAGRQRGRCRDDTEGRWGVAESTTAKDRVRALKDGCFSQWKDAALKGWMDD